MHPYGMFINSTEKLQHGRRHSLGGRGTREPNPIKATAAGLKYLCLAHTSASGHLQIPANGPFSCLHGAGAQVGQFL